MAVLTRRVSSQRIGGFTCLGAVLTADGVIYAGFPAGTPVERLRAALATKAAEYRPTGSSLLAVLPKDFPISADTAETDLLAGKNVLFAIRNGERPEATLDWLQYHSAQFDADAALILDRDEPEGGFAQQLAALSPPLTTIVVSTDLPLGMPAAADARHPSTAPAAPKRIAPPIDPWHAPIGQLVIYELLRRRFLSEARAVALLDICDLLMPDHRGTVFDRAVSQSGRLLMLHGLECYPWRLRRGRPASHGDHIAVRRDERRWLSGWAADPRAMPDTSVWKPVRATGVAIEDVAPAPFRRAMGAMYPGAPVETLVKKSDLVEDPVLLEQMSRGFGARPIRLPAPALIPPRPAGGKVTVVSVMKNEGPFILDWIAHNRAIGIETHLVYTNDCEDGTVEVLNLLGEAGVIRRDNPFRAGGKVPQHAAFRAAEGEAAVRSADWLVTLDVDEYINIHAGDGKIADLLCAAPEAHVISMPWRLFGNSDRREFVDRPVTELFTRAAPPFAPRPIQAWAFKSLYRNAGLFRRLGVHRPKGIVKETQGGIRWIDGSGRELPPNIRRSAWRMSKATWGYDLVSLNHYAVRSAESFLVKNQRGRPNHTTREQGQAYWFRMNHNAVEDTSIRHRDAAREKEKAALLRLPGVAEAHENSVLWHKNQIAQLKTVPTYATLFAEITSSRLQNLSRMATNFGANVHHLGPQVIPEEIALRDPQERFFFTVDLT